MKSTDPAVMGAIVAISAQNTENERKLQQIDEILHPENYQKYPKEHSLLLWLLFGGMVLYIPAIYYTFSKKHKWHW